MSGTGQEGSSTEVLTDVEAWCRHFVLTGDLGFKTAPPAPPERFREGFVAERLAAPGRPAALDIVERSPGSIKPGALVRPEARAELLHRFWHHELQAAELFAWAVLAFPETPELFRKGLLKIVQDEIRHMGLYAREVERLGFALGDFPVRDWFWERVPTVASPASFVALVGLGLEAANLDHAPLFTEALAAHGDTSAAEVEQIVGVEEERHVGFACHWFKQFTGEALTFEAWCAALPEPLTPLLFRGKQLNFGARERAGQDSAFLEALAAWQA